VRIVAVADTHTSEAQLGTIHDGDIFVRAGDLLRGGRLDELIGVAAWIRSLPRIVEHRRRSGVERPRLHHVGLSLRGW
jgi:hypothetical protein